MRKKLRSTAKKSWIDEQVVAKEFSKYELIVEPILLVPARIRKWLWKAKTFSLALAGHPLQYLQQYDTVSLDLLHWKSKPCWAKHFEAPKKYFQYNLKSAQGECRYNKITK